MKNLVYTTILLLSSLCFLGCMGSSVEEEIVPRDAAEQAILDNFGKQALISDRRRRKTGYNGPAGSVPNLLASGPPSTMEQHQNPQAVQQQINTVGHYAGM